MAMRPQPIAADKLLDAAVSVPGHVIFREFASETVALNILSGQFHGLNPTAGRMVELVGRAAHARDAIEPLAAEYGIAADQIERDLVALLQQLAERELIELHG
jgi:hypothetical protein